MTTKNFNVKHGLTTGNITLDAASSNITAGNITATGTVSAVSLMVSGNLKSSLIPNANSVLNLGNATNQFNDLYLGGNLTLGVHTITANSTNITIPNLAIDGQLVINTDTQAISTDTGSFVTPGGVGVGKDLYVGGAIHLANGLGGTTSKGSIGYNDGVDSIDFKFNG
jgi:hypothetical protein